MHYCKGQLQLIVKVTSIRTTSILTPRPFVYAANGCPHGGVVCRILCNCESVIRVVTFLKRKGALISGALCTFKTLFDYPRYTYSPDYTTIHFQDASW